MYIWRKILYIHTYIVQFYQIYPADGFDRILVVSVEKDQVEEREGEDTGQ